MTINIGYEFKDASLLTRALTHVSAVGGKGAHNETLEFFGDSVLDLYIASRLMALMPDTRENVLADRRSRLTCEDSLYQVAQRARLSDGLIAGQSIREPSPRMLADAMEAVIGAAFLDGGFPAIRAIDEALGLVR